MRMHRFAGLVLLTGCVCYCLPSLYVAASPGPRSPRLQQLHQADQASLTQWRLGLLLATLILAVLMAYTLGLTPSSPAAVWAWLQNPPTPPSPPQRPTYPLRRAAPQPSSSPSPSTSSQTHHAGIYNAGNTCFMNATLQALGSIPAFLTQVDAAREAAYTEDLSVPVSDASGELWADLNATRTRPWAIHASALTNALSTPKRSKSGWNARTLTGAHEQQDAHELLLLLLDALEDEALRTQRYRFDFARLATAGLRTLLPGPSKPPESPALQALHTLVGRMTRCLVCGYTAGVRLSPSPVLELSAPSGGQRVDLATCLAAWAQEERVEWTCWRCSVMRTYQRLNAQQAMLKTQLDRLKTRLPQVQAAPQAQIQASDALDPHNATPEPDDPTSLAPSTSSSVGRLSASAKKRKRRKGKSSTYTMSPEEAEHVQAEWIEVQAELESIERVQAQIERILRDNIGEDEVEAHGVSLPPASAPAAPQSPLGVSTPPPEPSLMVTDVHARALAGDDAPTTLDPSRTYEELWSALRHRGDRFPGLASTRHTIVRGGQVLAIHLSRSAFLLGGGAVKNNAFVPFSERMTLPATHSWFDPQLSDAEALALTMPEQYTAYLASQGTPMPTRSTTQQLGRELGTYTREQTYRLMAVVVHLGSHGFGHYIAFRRRPSSGRRSEGSDLDGDSEDEFGDALPDAGLDWLRISDALVTPCSLGEVMAQPVYLLFYERVNSGKDWPESAQLGGVPVPSPAQQVRRALNPRTVSRASL